MTNPDPSLNECFYERVAQLKKYYQQLIRDDSDSDVIKRASRGIWSLDHKLEMLIEREGWHGPDVEERRILLGTIMDNLLQIYSFIGRESDLGFDFNDIIHYIGYRFVE